MPISPKPQTGPVIAGGHISQIPPRPQSLDLNVKGFATTIALHRALGASHLMHPGGPSHNPNRDTRKQMDHQADARLPPQQAS